MNKRRQRCYLIIQFRHFVQVESSCAAEKRFGFVRGIHTNGATALQEDDAGAIQPKVLDERSRIEQNSRHKFTTNDRHRRSMTGMDELTPMKVFPKLAWFEARWKH
jgi:hypothetical protein